MNAQTYAAAQLLRVAAYATREAMGELARARPEEDYERYNARVATLDPYRFDKLALELEQEAAR